MDRKDRSVDDNINNDPRTPRDAIRKGGKQTNKIADWWYKLVDDNINDDSIIPKDAIRKDDWKVKSAGKADNENRSQKQRNKHEEGNDE